MSACEKCWRDAHRLHSATAANEALRQIRDRLVAALREVTDSVPSTFDPDDPMVQRHARALNMGAALLHDLDSQPGAASLGRT